MKRRFRAASLVPSGLIVDGIAIEGDRVIARVRAAVGACRCPDCGAISQRIQSRHFRRAKDLPLSGRRVELQILVRRFRCDAVLCGRQIFAERFGDSVLAPRARRTDRLDHIVKRTGHHRQTVRRIVRGERSDVFRPRQSSLEAHLPWLDAQWDAGARNASALWRAMRKNGFRGSLRVVSEWATRRRRAEKVDASSLARVPSARTIARLMTTGRDNLTKAETVTIAAIETGVPALVDAREIIAGFHTMIRSRRAEPLATWIESASQSLVASLGNGVRRDEAAVRAAILSVWSNGQTEGQITRLKLVKRQMYGRGKIDLLQARLIGAQ